MSVPNVLPTPLVFHFSETTGAQTTTTTATTGAETTTTSSTTTASKALAESGASFNRTPSIQFTPFAAYGLSLEAQFMNEVTRIDLSKPPNFPTYLVPNEQNVHDLRRHLEMIMPGLLVSTGTERSFFDLALINPELCEGLVVRDFHPFVKAYVDFNVLLLRISNNMDHYAELSTINFDVQAALTIPQWFQKQYTKKIDEIRKITENANLPPEIKKYYLANLNEFGSMYFIATQGKNWRQDSHFDGVCYHRREDLFNQLQRYARSGNIIATVGDMSQLQFLDKRNIEILDISNIPDYAVLNFKTKSIPIIITTSDSGPRVGFEYQSSLYRPLTERQSAALDGIFRRYESAIQALDHVYIPRDVPRYYCERLLYALKPAIPLGNPKAKK